MTGANMVTPFKLLPGMILATVCLSGCDPAYGGIHNYYSEAVKVRLDTNDSKVINTLSLAPGQGFAYREPTKILGINITTAEGKTITYGSTEIEKIALDIQQPNEKISWALTPQGLFADCVQHTVMVDCRKPGVPPSQWQESP
jgi:hypothetical protein